MSIRYGMDTVPGKIISVSFNEGKKQLCFVIEDINGRRLPVSYDVHDEMVLPDRVLTGIMLKESDVPVSQDINLDLITEVILRVNSIGIFAKDNGMDKEFNALLADCGFLQEDELPISLNTPDVIEDDDVAVIPDTANDIKAEKTAHNEEDEYYDTVVFSTTETSFIPDCIGYPKTRITPKDDEWNIEITFSTRRLGNNTVNVLLPYEYNPTGIIDSINMGIYHAVEEKELFKIDLNLFTDKEN